MLPAQGCSGIRHTVSRTADPVIVAGGVGMESTGEWANSVGSATLGNVKKATPESDDHQELFGTDAFSESPGRSGVFPNASRLGRQFRLLEEP